MTREKLILASASPRRRQFLRELGLDFSVIAADVDETVELGEQAQEFVQRMAREKATAVGHQYPESWVIGGDTVVVLDGVILGKPANGEDAVNMLMRLSGKEHTVSTGLCLFGETKGVCAVREVSSLVCFSSFDEVTARAYVATGEPMDKAGSYGIQGKGASLVRRVNGSYTNIVGLPLCELIDMLSIYGLVSPSLST